MYSSIPSGIWDHEHNDEDEQPRCRKQDPVDRHDLEAERLLADGSPSSRSLVAAAVAKIGELPRLKTTQVEEWRHLVDFCARDPATVVRAVLAETVKRTLRGSFGWVWRSSTPADGSPRRREV